MFCIHIFQYQKKSWNVAYGIGRLNLYSVNNVLNYECLEEFGDAINSFQFTAH